MTTGMLRSGSVANRPRAFTLIELLIVVAIIAVMSGATFALITAPLQEDVFSRIDAAAETGLATVFSALVQDTHGASALEPLRQSRGVRLRGAGPDGADVVYFVDAKRQLRRVVTPAGPESQPAEGSGAAILENVEELTVEPVPDSALWQVRVRGGTTRFGRALLFDRQVMLGVGVTSFSGGKS